MSATLLLSQGYEPISTISWQRAICMLMLGKVEIVEEYNQNLHSVSWTVRMPAVVRLIRSFQRHKHRVKFSRQNVLARDQWRCQYCGDRKAPAELTYDHVIPKSRGGRTTWENIVTACVSCNSTKANRTPQQAGMRLRQRPTRPAWIPIFRVGVTRDTAPLEWTHYLWV